MAKVQNDQLWALAREERAALAEDLSNVSAEQWQHHTLCGQWNVEQVLAHLTAAASLNQWQWIGSIFRAGFRPDVHNQRALEAHLGRTPGETLERFQKIIASTTAPSGHTPAYLGEVVVHAQDIRQPLGIARTPAVEALPPVARFFAANNFTVNSRSHAAGVQLKADDGPFTAGTGPLVTGPTLALVMTMAGRTAYLDQLEGPGLHTLRQRLEGSRAS